MVISPLSSPNLGYLGMLEHLKCYFGRSLAFFVEKKKFCDSIQEIKFNYGKLGHHVAKKKEFKAHAVKKINSNLKTQKVGIQKKKKIQKNNKTSTAVDVLFMIHPLSA